MLELEDINLVGRKRFGVVEAVGVYSSGMHSAVTSRSVCASLLVHVRRSIVLALPDICPTEGGSLLTDGNQVT